MENGKNNNDYHKRRHTTAESERSFLENSCQNSISLNTKNSETLKIASNLLYGLLTKSYKKFIKTDLIERIYSAGDVPGNFTRFKTAE